MDKPELLSEFELAFFEDGRKIAATHLKQNITVDGILAMAEEIYQYIDSFILSFENYVATENSRIDCKKSCNWCCYQSVLSVPHEMYYLIRYLNKHFDEPEREGFYTKLRQRNEQTIHLEEKDFLSLKSACPFLSNNGTCSVYEARPLSCRIYLSADVNSCIAQYNKPHLETTFAKVYDLPLRTGRMLNDGATAYLQEKGVNSYEWLLETNMLKALQKGSFKSWLAGEDVFKSI